MVIGRDVAALIDVRLRRLERDLWRAARRSADQDYTLALNASFSWGGNLRIAVWMGVAAADSGFDRSVCPALDGPRVAPDAGPAGSQRRRSWCRAWQRGWDFATAARTVPVDDPGGESLHGPPRG